MHSFSILAATIVAGCNTGPDFAPVADAGPDQLVALGETAVLDASGSSDADGVVTEYEWTLISSPQDSEESGVISGAEVELTPDLDGTWTYSLVVVDDDGLRSAPDIASVIVAGANSPPVAELLATGTLGMGVALTLDGSGSYDPDGDTLEYFFRTVVKPGNSSADVESLATEPSATFTPDLPGFYVLGLEVSDGSSVSARDDVEFEVTEGSTSTSPNAVCPADTYAAVSQWVEVDGSASSDPDGDPLSYNWSFSSIPDGSTTVWETPGQISARFQADVAGTFGVQLTVSDGVLSDQCGFDVLVTETGDNLPPISDPGPDLEVQVGESKNVDGSNSYDPEGEALTYSWTMVAQPTGSNPSLTNTTDTAAIFEADMAGGYTLTLTVCDPADLCDTESVDINASETGTNNPPVPDAGSDQSVTLGDTVTLDGSGSYDPDGDAFTYAWGFKSVPTGSAITNSDYSDRYVVGPTFTPDVAGDYEVRLNVNDGSGFVSDIAVITVTDSGANTPPVPDAGSDQTVTLGDTVSLDASGSYDPDGDAITYAWGFKTVPTGSSITNSDYDDRYSVTPSFTPDVEGDYEVRVNVNDGSGYVSDIAVITVEPSTGANTPPVANAGADQSQCGFDEVEISGSATDADGDSMTYRWSFNSTPSGSALVNSDISDRTSEDASFTPDVQGTYTMTFRADDGTDRDTDTMDVDIDFQDAAVVYHFDDSSGTTLTDSGPNGLDGTASNGDWSGGYIFGAGEFDAEEITIPDDAALDLSSDFTIEMWVKANNGSNTAYEALLIKGGTTYSYALYRYGENAVYFYAQTTSGTYATLYSFGSGISAGEWHHVAVTWDSANAMELYIDGSSVATATAPNSIRANNQDLTLGTFPGYTYYDFDGKLDELIIHEVALSSSEVADRASVTEQFCTGDEDSTAPTAAITSPSDGSTASNSVIAIEGTASDDSEIYSISVNGAEAVNTGTNFDTWLAYVELSDGTNTIEVSTEDVVGNTDTTVDSIEVDWTETCYDDYDLVWFFDEDEGATAADSDADGIDLTESGTERTFGVYGNAVSFDGSSYASASHDSALSYAGVWTADFWYASEPTSDVQVLFHKGQFNYAAAVEGDDIYCLVNDSAGDTYYATATGFNDGDWHHVVCSFTGTYLRIFVDGAREDRTTVSGPLDTNSDDFYVGSALGATWFYEGLLDNLRMWRSTLTVSDAAALAAEGEMCAVSDNLAPDGTASASSQLSVNYSADKVIDGDTSETEYADETYWLLNTAATGYVEVDLGTTVGITRFRWVNTHHGPRYSYATEDWELRVSSTGQFAGEETVVASGTGDLETDLRYHQEDLSAPATGQYVRFYVDSYHSTGGGLNELEIYGVE